MNPDVIRPATIAESEAVERLVNSAYRPADALPGWTHESGMVAGPRISRDQVEALIRRAGSVVLVGIVGGEPVACVHVEMSGDTSHIGMLAVDPAFQSRGMGRRLLGFAEEFSSLTFRAGKFAVEVITSRAELLQFYQRRGYHRTGRISPYPIDAGVGRPLHEGLTVEVLERPKGSFSIRGPREMLAGCVWLARLADKVRLHHAGRLRDDHVGFLGHPRGVDGHFLRHFGLSRSTAFAAIIEAGDDAGVERWFLGHPNAFQEEIASWNLLAPNLGRTGFPGAKELQFVLLRVLEPEARVPGISTLFEAIELDDLAIQRKHPAP